jgi:hypothetical protein
VNLPAENWAFPSMTWIATEDGVPEAAAVFGMTKREYFALAIFAAGERLDPLPLDDGLVALQAAVAIHKADTLLKMLAGNPPGFGAAK